MFITMKIQNKPLVWLHGEIKTPPFSSSARIEAGFLFRLLQMGETLSMPHSRDPCITLERIVMNLELMMKTLLGELFIELITMP